MALHSWRTTASTVDEVHKDSTSGFGPYLSSTPPRDMLPQTPTLGGVELIPSRLLECRLVHKQVETTCVRAWSQVST